MTLKNFWIDRRFLVLLLVNLLTLQPLLANKAKKPREKKVVTTVADDQSRPPVPDVTPAEITFSNQVSPAFFLNEKQLLMMMKLFQGLVTFNEGTGSHGANEGNFLKFAGDLAHRIHSTIELDRDLNFSPKGPVRQWLLDNGFNENLALVMEAVRDHHDVDPIDYVVRAIANGQDPALIRAALSRISFMMPQGYSLASNPNLGSLFGENAGIISRQKAFILTPEGRASDLDPEVENSLEHLKAFRARISRIALAKDPSRWNRIKDHFAHMNNLYENIWSATLALEETLYDVQGLLDSIRYKITLKEVDTPREAAQLTELLGQATAMRRQAAATVEELILVPLNEVSLTNTAKALTRVLERVTGQIREFKRFAVQSIESLDVFLGLDRTQKDSLKYDTPWELAYQQARKLVESSGLGAKWEDIAVHKYLVKERHYTRHWIEVINHPEQRDSNGRVTRAAWTEYRHHNTSHDDDLYQNFNIPEREVSMDRKIKELQTKISRATTKDEISAIQSDLDLMIREQALYAASDSKHSHDYSDRFQARNINQLKQLEALMDQTKLREEVMERNLQEYNRGVEPNPKWKATVSAKLKEIDAKHAKRLQVVGYTALGIGTTGAIGGACYFFLTNGGL